MNVEESQLRDIVKECLLYPSETEWIEFKVNNGEYNQVWKKISALSNSACLNNKEYGFLIYGIEDNTHDVVWTEFSPEDKKEWGQPFLFKLAKDLNPDTSLPRVKTLFYWGKKVVVFIVPAALDTPTSFNNISYIRIDSATPPLSEYPDKERKIWTNYYNRNFEKQIAMSGLLEEDIFYYLDISVIQELLNIKNIEDPSEVIRFLIQNKIIKRSLSRFEITNLWAILFAKKLEYFDGIKTKGLRIIVYDGTNKSANHKSYNGGKWYALWFEEALKHISLLTPSFEQIVDGRRVVINSYPDIAIREFVANALVHQDLSISGISPMIEIYKDRIEISNPWCPLIEVDRFIDNGIARNEELSELMRKMKFCEKLGSWVDKAIIAIERLKHPAPKIETTKNTTKVTLFLWENVSLLTNEDKMRTCFYHCAIKHIHNDYMTNASLRERLNLPDTQTSSVSRIIKETKESGKIKEFDPNNKAPRHQRYVPYWI